MVLGITNTNVRLDAKLIELQDKLEAGGHGALVIPKLLKTTITKLATDKPLWDFIARQVINRSEVMSFYVEKDGERLGEIGRCWHGSDYAIFVKNKRISDSLTRSDRYKTADPEKAVLKVKKMFGAMSTKERIAAASANTAQAINLAVNNKWSQLRDVEVKIERVSSQYIKEEGYEGFVAWLKSQHTQKAKDTLEGIDNKVRLGIEMLTIEKVKDHFNNGKAVLVIRDDGKYIVKMGDKVDLYDDNTLPQEMRGKLGVLKLVEAEQFVTDTGCRINAETFVLILEEVKNEG